MWPRCPLHPTKMLAPQVCAVSTHWAVCFMQGQWRSVNSDLKIKEGLISRKHHGRIFVNSLQAVQALLIMTPIPETVREEIGTTKKENGLPGKAPKTKSKDKYELRAKSATVTSRALHTKELFQIHRKHHHLAEKSRQLLAKKQTQLKPRGDVQPPSHRRHQGNPCPAVRGQSRALQRCRKGLEASRHRLGTEFGAGY